MIIEETEYLAHYGTPQKSGRYPWGSGGNEVSGSQRHMSLLDHIEALKRTGLSDTDIARGMGMTTTQLRARKAIAKNELKQAQIGMAQRLKDKGYSNVAIGERMGVNESSVRALLVPGQKDKTDKLQSTAAMLRAQVEQKGIIDVGSNVELNIGVSRTQLDTAIAVLKDEGYVVVKTQVDQLGTGNKTILKTLAPAGTTYRDVVTNMDKIKQIDEHTEDFGNNFTGVGRPLPVKSSRVGVVYAEQGGTQADGVMYIRPGVDDISLGASRYAQVRIAVDGTHYLKGMAMYKDDLPDGVDILFNTNKSDTGNKLDALKKVSDDPDNPFGATVRPQRRDKNGKVNTSINVINDEGTWDNWNRNLSTQFLSKQSPKLVKEQLDVTHTIKKDNLDEIMALTNPAVRKKLLESFADDADSSAIHLKAAALPRQATQVILPLSKMKDTEIYAPNYRNGERVVIVRFPHGGIFEIPELVVNNNNAQGKKLLGSAKDAVGINAKVAERLSGADFDGDTVLVIPNNSNKVRTAPPLAGLKNFDPKAQYPAYEGMAKMSARQKGLEMGGISNLITDMTIQGAPSSEIARAVRHSMVVIDAEKHNLNYKQSAKDNAIGGLKLKYQGKSNAGSSTLISRAGSNKQVAKRKPRSMANGGPIDKKTGKKVYEDLPDNTYEKTTTNKRTGVSTTKTITKSEWVSKLGETDNAHTLSSGTPVEKIYADHSNQLKSLANQARREATRTKSTPYSPSAKAAYSKDVATLNAQLNTALRNRPRERQAQLIANATVKAKQQANPGMERDELKKVKSQALNDARIRAGAKKTPVVISASEWNAIQAGAISNHKLDQILKEADIDLVKKLATPKTTVLMTSSKTSKAKSLLASGYTQAEVADALGVSLTTLKTSIV